ncbi:alpha/beta hydrolase [Micromonospora sp. WMMD1082]|uniref:alpha/beta fold hydrolase n=1 Tax=Micromonospora sp. WMMD1082 TaxID=3016104 RepID=UPI002415FC2E|nr:alpha/beta hydrolase [Micromonospora sp. WMMD1082]MDG4792744.1 alpha/beta hydrolase [Micromonospora sp. WMMD1082]
MLPVVFVHGLIGSFGIERWPTPPDAPPSLSPDLIGYGVRSGADPAAITIDAQVGHLLAEVDRAMPGGRVHLVGHSVGGVIAMAFAHRHPGRVASVVNVEGNFAPADAFWSSQLAAQTPAEVAEFLRGCRRDPVRWLRDGGIRPTEDRVRRAGRALAFQPASTLHATARAVVEFTTGDAYQRMLREVFGRTAVHLVAGRRSRAGWHVPGWALDAAASYHEVPDAGHMIALEAPERFGRTLDAVLRHPGMALRR